METKLNIAEILKDKPEGTKLYADAFGELSIRDVNIKSEFSIVLSDESGYILYFYSDGKYSLYGEPILFPSKEMRDWSKFAWKKGDLLVNSCGFQCIFKEWASNDYTKFNGCYSNSRDGHEDISNARTDKFDKLDNNVAYKYIREIEKRLGGKLNLETLEVEKTQPKFKDGDILSIQEDKEHYHTIFILKEGTDVYVFFDYFHRILTYSTKIDENEKSICSLATEDEKKVLFAALEKENKAWDAEKKQIVNLKPKADKLKPFDKVLVKDEYYGSWEPAFFWKEVDVEDLHPYMIIGGKRYRYCEPYEGNENLLDY